MQVKISFTVDSDSIPEIVDDKIDEVYKSLEGIVDVIHPQVSDKSIVTTLSWIENTRKKLLQVDTKLADCYSILAGYGKLILESHVNQDHSNSAEEGHDSPVS